MKTPISRRNVLAGLPLAGASLAATAEMLARDLATSGSLNEYYHPDTGKPLSHKDFVDWNLLVLEMTQTGPGPG